MISPVRICAIFHLGALAILGAALYWLFSDSAIARSFVLGGGIYSLPNLYFVHYAFRFQGASHVPLVLRSFSWGESGKFALAALGFILAFRFVEALNHGAMFAGFITMMVLQWFVAAHVVRRRDESQRSE